ncbi:MAG: hypothetical protein KatS3mg010_0743 [Acidimicrobiia bacterium]|nr:MAG: hypothetical protein KatS3mg010_0743 [Acidimicrobiia bacterium]
MSPWSGVPPTGPGSSPPWRPSSASSHASARPAGVPGSGAETVVVVVGAVVADVVGAAVAVDVLAGADVLVAAAVVVVVGSVVVVVGAKPGPAPGGVAGPTANAQPSTPPGGGTRAAAPTVENVQVDPGALEGACQYDQKPATQQSG